MITCIYFRFVNAISLTQSSDIKIDKTEQTK